MPAVMTVTANGVDTSPIVRGVYVLENVLGTPTPQPPPDIEPISPDLRGIRSMQEQLAIHRDQQACNACHRRIDPMGIALETFDPIGRLRERYPKVDNGSKEGPVIETSAVLASGREIKNVLEFKAMLVEQEKQFTKCLTEKLLTYATGRHLEPSDRGEVDRIINSLEKDGNRLRHLIHQIVQSDIFLAQ